MCIAAGCQEHDWLKSITQWTLGTVNIKWSIHAMDAGTGQHWVVKSSEGPWEESTLGGQLTRRPMGEVNMGRSLHSMEI
jgi:hypothetical protein